MMTTGPLPSTQAGPSIATLLRTTAIALVVAMILLIAFVLPAEYAIDPLGTGRRLGLTEIASPSATPVEDAAPQGAAMAPVRNGPIGAYPSEFKLDVFEIELAPYQYVEYKYRLEKDATMLYHGPRRPESSMTSTARGHRARPTGPPRRASTNRSAGRPTAATPHRSRASTVGIGRIPVGRR